MLLKEAAAHTAVETEGDVVVDVHDPLLHSIWKNTMTQ